MTIPETPPRWLAWTDKATTRAATTLIAIIALLLSFGLLVRLQALVDCNTDANRADAKRTAAIAAATDGEREADLALIVGARPAGPSAEQLRAAAVAARQYTDRVRAANPPGAEGGC